MGSHDTETGRKLCDAIKDNDIKKVMGDYWSPYELSFHKIYIHSQKLKPNQLWFREIDAIGSCDLCYRVATIRFELLQKMHSTLKTN